MQGSFSQEATESALQLLKGFTDSGVYEFTRCVRPDGTAYGTGGKCRKGTEAEITRLETGLFAIDDKNGNRVGMIQAPGALIGGGGIRGKGSAKYDLRVTTPDGKTHTVDNIPTLAAAKAKARQLLGEKKKGGDARAVAQGGLTTKGKARRIKSLQEDLEEVKEDMKIARERYLYLKGKLGEEGVKQDKQARERVMSFKALKAKHDAFLEELRTLEGAPTVG
jgi:hypothetical protein